MKSKVQDAFLAEYVDNFIATARRLERRLSECEDSSQTSEVVTDELRGLCHGLLVIFDGGTALAEKSLVGIVDEDGVMFDRYLHEIYFEHWPLEL